MQKTTKKPKIDYIEKFLDGIKVVCDTVSQEKVDKIVEIFFQSWLRHNTIFFIGNGGSAGTAMHFSADISNAAAEFDNLPQIKSQSLVENIVRYSALINDRGWNNVYVEQLKNYFSPGDVVVAISVHGGSGKDKAEPWSQNLSAALQYANDHGGTTIGLAGFDGGAFKDICNLCLIIPYNTTPHVEACHVIIHHLIFDELKRRIAITAQSFDRNEKK